jgi:hypothetical protein
MRPVAILLGLLLSAGASSRAVSAAEDCAEHPLRGKTFLSLELLPGGEKPDGTINRIHWKVTFADDSYEWLRTDVIVPGKYAFDAATGELTVDGGGGKKASFDAKKGILTWDGKKYQVPEAKPEEKTTTFVTLELPREPRSIPPSPPGTLLGRDNPRAVLPVGKWSIEFANGITEVCEIGQDGAAVVVEPLRIAGKAVVNGGAVLMLFENGRVQRWSAVGQRQVVEHWFPESDFPAVAPGVLGIADAK